MVKDDSPKPIRIEHRRRLQFEEQAQDLWAELAVIED